MNYNLSMQMHAEVKADCYAGEDCDQIGDHFFDIFCAGDKQGSEDQEDIVLRCRELPPGAVVTVQYPCCPECGMPRYDKLTFGDGGWKVTGHEEKCECGFLWDDWVRDQYS